MQLSKSKCQVLQLGRSILRHQEKLRSSSQGLTESSLGEVVLGVLVDTRLSTSCQWQCSLVARKENGILGCIVRSINSRGRHSANTGNIGLNCCWNRGEPYQLTLWPHKQPSSTTSPKYAPLQKCSPLTPLKALCRARQALPAADLCRSKAVWDWQGKVYFCKESVFAILVTENKPKVTPHPCLSPQHSTISLPKI